MFFVHHNAPFAGHALDGVPDGDCSISLWLNVMEILEIRSRIAYSPSPPQSELISATLAAAETALFIPMVRSVAKS
jgi:hypothetical protein